MFLLHLTVRSLLTNQKPIHIYYMVLFYIKNLKASRYSHTEQIQILYYFSESGKHFFI